MKGSFTPPAEDIGMAVPLVPTLVAIVALLGCSAFFSSSETALFSLSRE